MDTKQVLEWGTLAVAIYGAAIGTFNYFHERRRDIARIKIVPCIARIKSGGYRLAFKVINLSSFNISIVETGFVFRGIKTFGVFHPSIVAEHHLPIQLTQRSSIILYAPTSIHKDPRRELISCIYVKTADGYVVKGKNSALKTFSKEDLPAANDESVTKALQEWGTIITSVNGVPKGKLPGEE